MRRALLFLPLCGCFEQQVDCDNLSVTSVVVTALSSTEEPLDGVEVRYTAPGATDSKRCTHQGSTWLCGSDGSGIILIEASADCHVDVSESVTVPMGTCHPETQDLQLLMDPVDCTQDEIPSVLVTVWNEEGASVDDASVGYVPADQDWTDYEPCESTNGAWACGWDIVGALGLEVTAPDHAPWPDRVLVEGDCCGPLTENVEVVLYLTD